MGSKILDDLKLYFLQLEEEKFRLKVLRTKKCNRFLISFGELSNQPIVIRLIHAYMRYVVIFPVALICHEQIEVHEIKRKQSKPFVK